METQQEPVAITIDTSLSVQGHVLTCDNKNISLLEVIGIKYGYAPIRLDMYTIGSRYMAELRTQNEKIQLNFRSYFTIKKKLQYEKFNALINAIWDLTVVRLVNEVISAVDEGETVAIDQCQITQQGVLCKNFLIEWSDLTYQKNYNRLTINSKSNTGVWTNLYYNEAYNVHVFSSFLDWKFNM